ARRPYLTLRLSIWLAHASERMSVCCTSIPPMMLRFEVERSDRRKLRFPERTGRMTIRAPRNDEIRERDRRGGINIQAILHDGTVTVESSVRFRS
ncbi:MAG TPA: hypothetical protein VK673_16530, partial [Chthoniobacterales bacterium]|nr:hypothetical protein [Chthoniobacterales bacterium]